MKKVLFPAIFLALVSCHRQSGPHAQMTVIAEQQLSGADTASMTAAMQTKEIISLLQSDRVVKEAWESLGKGGDWSDEKEMLSVQQTKDALVQITYYNDDKTLALTFLDSLTSKAKKIYNEDVRKKIGDSLQLLSSRLEKESHALDSMDKSNQAKIDAGQAIRHEETEALIRQQDKNIDLEDKRDILKAQMEMQRLPFMVVQHPEFFEK